MVLPDKMKAALKKIPAFKKVVVAVSGGVDSVVLTHILERLGYEVIVAHLNHKIRGELATRDENFVIELAQAWKLPYVSNQAVIPEKGNLEDNARKIRYTYLESVRQTYHADYIAVGHHFDDQIETVLMHQTRGAGLRGRRGMPLFQGNIIRPLLDVTRHEIETYAKEHLLDYVTDETNFDLTLERNRLRHEVIPKLKKDPHFEDKMRQKINQAEQTLQALNVRKHLWMQAFWREDRFDREAFNKLKDDLKVEILIDLLGQEDIYSPTFKRIIDFIESGQTGKELTVKGVTLVIEYDEIRWIYESAGDLEERKIDKTLQWGDYRIEIKNMTPVKVRTWKMGDRFRPSGMKGTKKLQDFFVDEKVPRYKRKRIPILVDEEGNIICVGNLRFSQDHLHLKAKIDIQPLENKVK